MYHTDLRPDKWAGIAGNKQAVSYLKKMVKDESRPRVYIFQGPEGCGKTTLGRLFAKKLKGHLIEHDTAGLGVDFVRELRANASMGIIGETGPKVFLLDEVHYLRDDAQTVFLKLLEEPPKNVYFLLCTTDPKKLKKTLLRRCAPVVLTTLANKAMDAFIKKTLDSLGESLSDEAIETVIDNANGSPGTALVFLEQAVNGYSVESTEEVKAAAIDLCKALFNLIGNEKQWPVICRMLGNLKGVYDAEAIRRNIIGFAQWAVINQKESPGKCFIILEAFKEPTYHIGWPGNTLACLAVLHSEI